MIWLSNMNFHTKQSLIVQPLLLSVNLCIESKCSDTKWNPVDEFIKRCAVWHKDTLGYLNRQAKEHWLFIWTTWDSTAVASPCHLSICSSPSQPFLMPFFVENYISAISLLVKMITKNLLTWCQIIMPTKYIRIYCDQSDGDGRR